MNLKMDFVFVVDPTVVYFVHIARTFIMIGMDHMQSFVKKKIPDGFVTGMSGKCKSFCDRNNDEKKVLEDGGKFADTPTMQSAT